VENIEEELDPVLDPVLERRLIKKGKSWILQLADKEVSGTDVHLTRLHCCGR
jgi:dynein heavy chain